MSEPDVLPEIKQIIGAMIFAAGRPLSVPDMRKCLVEVAKEQGGAAAVFEAVKDSHVREALVELQKELNEKHKTGFVLTEVAGGFRYQSDRNCGSWIKHLLEIGRPNRLSKPALETLAIIAYRQPISKAEIESVRGVNVDHIMKSLLEYRLIKISGRSELPGRPFLYGTTQLFLEHFGLKNLKDLNDIEPMLFLAKESAAGRKKDKAEPVEEQEDIFENIPEDKPESNEESDSEENDDDADESDEDEEFDEDEDEEGDEDEDEEEDA
jgi:segregation and condensation protein B